METSGKRNAEKNGQTAKGSANRTKGADPKLMKRAVNKVQQRLDGAGDSGTKTLSETINVGRVAVKTFQASQRATPTLIKAGKGSYHIVAGSVKKTVKVVKTAHSTLDMVRTGAIKLDKDTAQRLINYTKYRLKNSRPAVMVVQAVANVKLKAHNAKQYVIKTAHNVRRAVTIVRGVASGTIKVHISKNTLNSIKNTAVKGVKVGVKAGAKGVGYVIKGGFKSTLYVGKRVNKGLLTAGDRLMGTGDMGLQSIGVGMKITHYTVRGISYTPKVANYAYKGVKTGVQGMYRAGRFAVKTTKNTYRGVKTGLKIYKKAGVSKATRMYAKRWSRSLAGRAKNAVAKAGKSVVTAVIEGIKKLGVKLIIPLLIILVVIFFGVSIITTVGSVIGAILSPFLSDDSGNEIDETALVTQQITIKRNDLIQDLKDTYRDNLAANHGEYHYIRFFNAFNDTEIDFTETNIATSIYSVQDYVEAIQPIFHTVILSEYDGAASERQMKNVLSDMWNALNTVTTEEMQMEYCNMSVAPDGTISPVNDTDGCVHADVTNCPNYGARLEHSDDTAVGLAGCDSWYYSCEGHQGSCTHTCNNDCAWEYNCGGFSWTHLIHNADCKRYYCGHSHSAWHSASDTGCYSTSYHSGNMGTDCGNSIKHKGCSGYYICGGHKILALSINLNSFGDLLNGYFLDEMRSLEAIASRTLDQEQRLSDLRNSYDLCMNYLIVLEEEYGYGTGSTVVDLDGVTLTPLTDLACSFIGNPYIWGGNDPHTGADCSGFVKYIYAQFGITMNRRASEQVRQGTLVASVEDAQAGDLVFWSEDGTDSGVYHVAIYLGNGKIVHASNSRPYPSGGIKVSNLYGILYKIKRMM